MNLRPPLRKIYWSLIILFFLFSIVITTAGYFFYTYQKKSLKEEKWSQLGVISDLKVAQIVTWRKERIEDGEVIVQSLFMGRFIQEWLEDPNTNGAEEEIVGWMRSLQGPQEYPIYHEVLLLDDKGTVRLSVPEGARVLDSFTKGLALESRRSQKVILSDLYRDETSDLIRLSLLVPVLIQKAGRPMAVAIILMRIDPYQFLYPLIQSWPTPSRSSETLLIRPEGEDVVYLNELRHRRNTALALRLPARREQLPSAMAVRGRAGITEGYDYRDVRVLAAFRHIPDSPWFLVAKVDQEEIYAPVRMQSELIASLAAVLVIGVAVALGFIWRGQHLRDRMRAEEEIKKLNENLRSRAAELENINEELEAFSYSVSHDLRSPLIGINRLSSLLLQKHSLHLDEKGRHFLGLITKETQRMLKLIDDLTAFIRLGCQQISVSPIDMGHLARTVFDELKIAMPDGRVSLEIKPLPRSSGDETMIRQVFYNLLSNAIKFTRPKKSPMIEIGCVMEEEENIYYVKDNGVGFDAVQAGKLFEVFERLHASEDFEGTGVGLAVVQRIIKRHGGRIWAEGKVDEGATFYFTLPKKDEKFRSG